MVKNKIFLDLNLLFFEVKTLKQNTNFSLSCLTDVGIKFEKNTLYVLRVNKFREWRRHTDLETSYRNSLPSPRGASFLLDGSHYLLHWNTSTFFVVEVSYPCTLKRDIGRCYRYAPRYYYDEDYARCFLFYYGGCHGNANRFLTRAACERKCQGES